MPAGRPTKYKKKYCKDIIAFADVEPYHLDENNKPVVHDLPQFIDFAMQIGVCTETLAEWRRVHPEFSVSYKKAKKLIEKNWRICSLRNLYAPAFTIFYGKNVFGWTDKQEIKSTVTIEDAINQIEEGE